VVASVLWKIGTVPTTDDEKNLGGPKGDTTKLGPKTQARFALHAFRQSGGIQAVVNVMDTFPDSAKLRKRASSIFVQLLVIEDAGGHKAVFSAVENTHKDKDNAYVHGQDCAVSR
jgi:hypothetical protein